MKQVIILLTLLTFHHHTLQAQEVVNAGKTIVSLGDVNANSPVETRALKRRSPVYTNEKIVTGQKSSAQIRMIDGGLLSLQQDSELDIVDYQFDQQNLNGQVRLKLIKGGLRTVTGALTASAKKYQMQTPVASIGVRGTHYEAEIVDGNLFLAVWDGDIDVDVEVGESPASFSLGNNEDFAFASVQPSGEVKLMLEVPSVFAVGHSEQNKAKQKSQEREKAKGQPSKGTTEKSAVNVQATSPESRALVENANVEFTDLFSNEDQTDLSTLTSISENIINKDLASLTPTSIDVIAQRTGTAFFSQVEDLGSVSTGGEVRGMEMTMAVNFSTQTIPGGELKFHDDNGQWFAAFDGVIGKESLEINVNSASHGNNVVEGSIHGAFVKDATKVLGGFSLRERDKPTTQTSGGFIVSEAVH